MTSLIKHNDLFNDIFPSWANWDRFDNYLMNNDPWTTGTGTRISSSNNKYRWNETDDSYTLDIVMPGLTKKDIDLTFKDGTLTIKCKKDVSDSDSQFYGVKTEQSFRNFPRAVNAEKVSAEMKEGILSIVLPKREPNKAKYIDIK